MRSPACLLGSRAGLGLLVCSLSLALGCPAPASDGAEQGTEGETTADADGTDTTDDGTDTGEPLEPAIMTILEEIVFYDGYAGLVDEPIPEGVIRHANSLVATKLSDEQLAAIQNTLMIGVINGALCDNYDRLGHVNLALVPKGADSYVTADVQRIEIARFITPFMNMNKEPTSVPYEWPAHNLVPLLKDEAIRAEYDIWLELSIFGVPYAANTEVPGCEGRNDTQLGTLLLYSDSAQDPEQFDTLIPLAINQTFNNYAEGASDAVGTTRKTIEFELAEDAEEAQLVLITSNHGANEGGEEYNRREHYVYVDGDLVLQYKPGRDSCEPWRKYNTQGNGIYGQFPRSDEEWQSFSNWCPGDVIDTRIVSLGPTSAGAHEFVIDVPDAVFADGQGNIPLSLYVQAR